MLRYGPKPDSPSTEERRGGRGLQRRAWHFVRSGSRHSDEHFLSQHNIRHGRRQNVPPRKIIALSPARTQGYGIRRDASDSAQAVSIAVRGHLHLKSEESPKSIRPTLALQLLK